MVALWSHSRALLLPDCDAYNHSQYISIHVRLFLSLADWKRLLNPFIIPASKVYLLSQRPMTNANSQYFFSHLESASTVAFTLLNYNNDMSYFLLVVIKEQYIFLEKNAMNKKCITLYCVHVQEQVRLFFSFVSAFFSHITHKGIHDYRPLAVAYYINSARALLLAAEVMRAFFSPYFSLKLLS